MVRNDQDDVAAALVWRILARHPISAGPLLDAASDQVVQLYSSRPLVAVGAACFLAQASNVEISIAMLEASLELIRRDEVTGFRSAFGSGLGVPEMSFHEFPLAIVLAFRAGIVPMWDKLAAVPHLSNISPRGFASLLRARSVALGTMSLGGGPRLLADRGAYLFLLAAGHLGAVLAWPKDLGGGINGVRRLVISFLEMISSCLKSCPASEWRPLIKILLKHGFVAKLTHAAKVANLKNLDPVSSLLYLLFRHNVRFVSQLAEAPEAPWMIKNLAHSDMMGLKIVVYLCRKHPEQVLLRVPGLFVVL